MDSGLSCWYDLLRDLQLYFFLLKVKSNHLIIVDVKFFLYIRLKFNDTNYGK